MCCWRQEADRLCNAQRYERREARRDTRAGHYERKLKTKAGEVRLRIPELSQQTFETAIIERYRRRESSVEEALIEMYPAGVSARGPPLREAVDNEGPEGAIAFDQRFTPPAQLIGSGGVKRRVASARQLIAGEFARDRRFRTADGLRDRSDRMA